MLSMDSIIKNIENHHIKNHIIYVFNGCSICIYEIDLGKKACHEQDKYHISMVLNSNTLSSILLPN